MNELEVIARELISWLNSTKLSYALVGGLAVSFHADERFTKDIDLVVAVTGDQHAEQVIFELGSLGFLVDSVLEQSATGRLSTARLYRSGYSQACVDLLFASSGIESEVAQESSPLEVFAGFHVNVASRSSLLALKILAAHPDDRPQDVIDIKNLLANATNIDLERVTQLLTLINNRGYHRQKDLFCEFATYLQRFRDVRG